MPKTFSELLADWLDTTATIRLDDHVPISTDRRTTDLPMLTNQTRMHRKVVDLLEATVAVQI